MRKYGGKPARALFDVAAHDDADGQSRLAARRDVRRARRVDPRRRTTSSPATTPLPADPQLLAAMQVPAGGFSFMAFSPYTARPAVDRPTPLADFNAVTDDAIADAAGRRLARLAAQLRRARLQPAARDRHAQRRRTCGSRGAGRCRRARAESVPLVRDGTIFVQAYGDIVQALDAKTGDLLWQYTHTLEQGASPFHKRGLALHGNRLYLGTSDVHVVALDVATGEVVWDTKVGDFRRREGLNGGPLVARGKVMVGTTGTGVAAKIRRAADRRPRRRDRRGSRGGSARSRSPASPAARAGTASRSSSAAARRSGRRAATTRDRPRLLRHRQHLRHGPAAASRTRRARRATRSTRTRRSP